MKDRPPHVISEMQIRTMRFNHIPIRMAPNYKTDNAKAGEDL